MLTKPHHIAGPIQVPEDWPDHGLLNFEEFCTLIRIPQRTVRDWRQRGVGPRWGRLKGTGRLYLTVAEAREFLATAREEATAGA